MNRAAVTRRLNAEARRDELFHNYEKVMAERANFTERDRQVRAELEASEMLREFLATEL
jgi:hypothetical protein